MTVTSTSTSAVPIVRVENVSKRFVIRKDKSIKERLTNFNRGARHREDFWALQNIDLEIEAGSTIGLIGPNGSGKSTLLKTIGGIIRPTTGRVLRRGQLAALLELGAGFHPDLTGRENVYLNASILGLSREETDEHFDDIVEFSGIGEFIDTQVKFYSSGMYVRLAFAVAINVNPDILLVDEVLAVGDEAFQKKCLAKIRDFQEEGRTIILVTHTLSQITDLCTRAVVLAKGHVVFDGDPEDAVSILRSGFATVPEAKKVPETAAEKAEVTAVRVLDADGAPQQTFAPGADVVIEADVSATTPVDAWAVGLHIDNPLGQLILGTTTGSLKTDPVGPLDGAQTVRFRLSNTALGPGDYGVTIAVMGSKRQEIARASREAEFRVVSTSPVWGPAMSDVAFEALSAR
ncbi:ABC transporter ATP-binding protein [Agromyces aerolatus]|uniref:ABC transporter ATP-binding protein n=1 Tax=Agromyces sp. LY-1074 TaxID=3074080 RepID=UPI00285D31FA|nr:MULTISPECIES: ABC transporter ATP-binding protein [unclassified Agromyces]MDR5700375.1 ABC transporter ATP-binding protein [Agromyces sp. LY-1074]MDR5706647.1 ABC transporter ATP-binding protein [Agromyces sp. LY-1358]